MVLLRSQGGMSIYTSVLLRDVTFILIKQSDLLVCVWGSLRRKKDFLKIDASNPFLDTYMFNELIISRSQYARCHVSDP